jgi:hypothetical protein
MTLHGAADEDFMGFALFHLDDNDIATFPELKDTSSVAVYECDQGFVYSLLEPK